MQIFRRRDTLVALEDLRKSTPRRKTRGKGHVLQFDAGLLVEHLASVLQTHGIDELVERPVLAAGYGFTQVGLVGENALCKVVQGQVVFQIEFLASN